MKTYCRACGTEMGAWARMLATKDPTLCRKCGEQLPDRLQQWSYDVEAWLDEGNLDPDGWATLKGTLVERLIPEEDAHAEIASVVAEVIRQRVQFHRSRIYTPL